MLCFILLYFGRFPDWEANPAAAVRTPKPSPWAPGDPPLCRWEGLVTPPFMSKDGLFGLVLFSLRSEGFAFGRKRFGPPVRSPSSAFSEHLLRKVAIALGERRPRHVICA